MQPSSLKYLFFFICLLAACKQTKKIKPAHQSPPGYSFDNPVKIKLSVELDEISGIAYDTKQGSLVALNDEEGKLFRLSTEGQLHENGSRFHKGGDYEDLCFDGSFWYALRSNGTISRIFNPLTDSSRSEEFKFPIKGKFDFETIFPEPGSQRLILLCKSCKGFGDKVPGFAFSTNNNQTDSVPAFYLDISGLPTNPLKPNEELNPSAAAFHPITGDLFVLASANNLLLITNKEGKAKEVFKLDNKTFKQPEGICFTPSGDLFISNEARTGTANILHFVYTPQKP